MSDEIDLRKQRRVEAEITGEIGALATEAKQDVQIIQLTDIEADTDNLDVPLSTRLSKTDFESRINTLGQKTMALSTPVVIASNQTVIPVSIDNATLDVILAAQQLDASNTGDFDSTTISTISPFIGVFSQTRSVGVLRQLTLIVGTASPVLGGTFVFEYSEDGINTTISESRTIEDFTTVRDFDLINVGEYYRVKFTPSRNLTVGEFISISTVFRYQYDGQFVRLANQEIEELNAAMPQTFSYVKAFNEDTQKSENIRVENGGLRVSTAKAMTYRGAFRTTTVPNTISISLTAITTVQIISIYHSALSTKKLKIKKCVFHMSSVSNGGNISVDLLRITTEPTGGTVITSDTADPNDTAPESVLRVLPSVAGTTGNTIYTFGLKLANSDKNIDIKLLEELAVNDIKPPTVLAGVAGGFAVVVRADATTILTGNVDITFSEDN